MIEYSNLLETLESYTESYLWANRKLLLPSEVSAVKRFYYEISRYLLSKAFTELRNELTTVSSTNYDLPPMEEEL